jgi:hypothetical protein
LGPGGAAIEVLNGCQPKNIQLAAAGGAAQIGANLSLSVAAPAQPVGLASLFLGLPGAGPGGCGLFLDGIGELLLALDPQPLLFAQVPLAAGQAAFVVPVAQKPAWIGLEVGLQAAVMGSGPSGLEVGLSNGLALRIGQ